MGRDIPALGRVVDGGYVGSCTAKDTIFCANIAAGWMLEQFAGWLRGLPLDADLSFNLLASECVVATPQAA